MWFQWDSTLTLFRCCMYYFSRIWQVGAPSLANIYCVGLIFSCFVYFLCCLSAFGSHYLWSAKTLYYPTNSILHPQLILYTVRPPSDCFCMAYLCMVPPASSSIRPTPFCIITIRHLHHHRTDSFPYRRGILPTLQIACHTATSYLYRMAKPLLPYGLLSNHTVPCC